MTGLERRVRVVWWGTLAAGAIVITVALMSGQWLAVPVMIWGVTIATALRVLAAAVPDYVDVEEEYPGLLDASRSRHRLGRPRVRG